MSDIITIFNESPISDRWGKTDVKFYVGYKDILKVVCIYFNISLATLKKKSRKIEILFPRQIAAYLMSMHTSLSLVQIATELGYKEHTNIIHTRETIRNRISVEKDLKDTITELKWQLLKYEFRPQVKNKIKPTPTPQKRRNYIHNIQSQASNPIDYKRPPAVYSNKSPYHIAS